MINQSVLKELMPIGVLLTFIASALTIYFTRKNMKTTKYIETITVERIKWMELLRNDLSSIYSDLLFLFNKVKEYHDLSDHISAYINDLQNENVNSRANQELDELEQEYSDLEEEIFNEERRLQLVKQIYLIILRLNPKEDKEIIDNLKFIRKVVANRESLTKENIKEALKLIETIMKQSQEMLKEEWEKVKNETVKGSKVK